MAELPRADAEVSPAAAAAARDLVLLFRQLRDRMREVPAAGLAPAQASVLMRLDRDGASSTTLLAAAEGIRSQSMSATVAALEAKGLIERRADPSDGRRFILSLSDAGRRVVRDGRELRHRWVARALGERLTPEQLDAVADAIGLLTNAIRNAP